MSKLLVTDTGFWYDELSVVSFYSEDDFEKEILNHFSTIFPDFFGVLFKFSFSSPVSTVDRKADILIVKKDLSEWWITEVEKVEHSINHITEQIKVFYKPSFNARTLAEFIHPRLTARYPTESIAFDSVYYMTRFVDHKLLVIIDEDKEGLEKELKQFECLLCILQVFKETTGGHAYRLDGDYPKVVHRDSHCRLVKGSNEALRETLEVVTPDILDKFPNKSEVVVIYRRKQTLWRKIVNKNKTYLMFAGRDIFPLSISKDYVLEELADKSLHLL